MINQSIDSTVYTRSDVIVDMSAAVAVSIYRRDNVSTNTATDASIYLLDNVRRQVSRQIVSSVAPFMLFEVSASSLVEIK